MNTASRIDSSSVPEQTGRPTQPLVFKMRAEFRRSAVYFEIGLVLIVPVCCVIVHFFPFFWVASLAMLLLSLSNYPRGIASVIGMMVMMRRRSRSSGDCRAVRRAGSSG